MAAAVNVRRLVLPSLIIAGWLVALRISYRLPHWYIHEIVPYVATAFAVGLALAILMGRNLLREVRYQVTGLVATTLGLFLVGIFSGEYQRPIRSLSANASLMNDLFLGLKAAGLIFTVAVLFSGFLAGLTQALRLRRAASTPMDPSQVARSMAKLVGLLLIGQLFWGAEELCSISWRMPGEAAQMLMDGLANMAELVFITLSGALWWALRETPSLQGNARLKGARLHLASLTGADLRGVDLTCAQLNGADLAGADLRGANLRGAILTDARYDAATRWPADFDPRAHGALLVG